MPAKSQAQNNIEYLDKNKIMFGLRFDLMGFFLSGKIFLSSDEFGKRPDGNVATALSSDSDDGFRNQREISALTLMQQKSSDQVIFKANASTTHRQTFVLYCELKEAL